MFFLISRHGYATIGGHYDVRDLAVEDIGIGKRVKAAGLGLLFANGRNLLRTRMYTGFSEIVNGWIRILSGSMNYRLSAVIRHMVEQILVSLPVFVAALACYAAEASQVWPNTWFLLPAACILMMAVVPHFFYSQIGVPPKYMCLLAVGNLVVIWSFAVMVKRILCHDALQWRGTTYRAARYQPMRLEPPWPTGYPSRPPNLEKAKFTPGPVDII